MTDIKWGGWTALSAAQIRKVIDSGRITPGVPVKISKKASWLPAWLSRAFTDLNKRTAVVDWPAPGGTLGPDVQAVAFKYASGWDHVAVLVTRGY